jgi:hypothetical protein
MWTGVQWTGTIAPNTTHRWFTWGWPAAWHVVWYMMPTSPQPGAPELGWDVAVERANATQCTYWITVKNPTANAVTFEGRFAVLS